MMSRIKKEMAIYTKVAHSKSKAEKMWEKVTKAIQHNLSQMLDDKNNKTAQKDEFLVEIWETQ